MFDACKAFTVTNQFVTNDSTYFSATRDCTLPYMRGDEVAYTSIPSGTILFVGIAGSNRSKAVWGDDAQEWKPERWLGNKGPKEKVPGIYSGM